MPGSHIEWTDWTCNVMTGCTPKGVECNNCYAVPLSWRHQNNPNMGDKYQDVVRKTPTGVLKFTGHINIDLDAMQPLIKRKKPTRVFLNSMSDTFYESVDFDTLDEIMRLIRACPQHTFQILTKRAERMCQYFQSRQVPCNVWLGVTVGVKNSIRRIGYLQQINAPVRFLSCEPLLEDLGELNLTGVHQVIVGGESGCKARPMHVDWVRSLRDQCVEQYVAFFFKQWGEWVFEKQLCGGAYEGIEYLWRVRKKSQPLQRSWKVGKKNAGCLLDCVEHKAFPNNTTNQG